jgi:hypothetical protein
MCSRAALCAAAISFLKGAGMQLYAIEEEFWFNTGAIGLRRGVMTNWP